MNGTAIKKVGDAYAGEEVDFPIEVDKQTKQQLLGYRIEHWQEYKHIAKQYVFSGRFPARVGKDEPFTNPKALQSLF